MTKNKSKKLSKFNSTNELVKYFDENDLGDYLDHLEEVEFEVDIRKREPRSNQKLNK